MTQGNRESWLNRVAAGMAPLFEALDAPPCPRVSARPSASPAGSVAKIVKLERDWG